MHVFQQGQERIWILVAMNVGREYLGGVRREESIIKAHCTKTIYFQFQNKTGGEGKRNYNETRKQIIK